MARWCRLLLFVLVPLLAAVPVDAIVCCVFQPATCGPFSCEPADESAPAVDDRDGDVCGGCAEESSDDESEEPEDEAPTTDCCCAFTVVAETGQLASLTDDPPVRAAGFRIARLRGRATSPETPPPLR